jgi:ABC-type transport system substrate-binding protein
MKLFWDKTNLQDESWKVYTCVKQSSIPNAGLGRFSLDVIPKDTVIRKQNVTTVEDFLLCKDVHQKTSCVITFENLDQIDHLVNILHENNETISLDEIKMKLTWFFAGNQHLSPYMSTFSGYLNHNVNNNVSSRIIEENDKVYLEQYASKYIEINDELYTNYQNLVFPQYYYDWCKANNQSVVTEYL